MKKIFIGLFSVPTLDNTRTLFLPFGQILNIYLPHFKFQMLNIYLPHFKFQKFTLASATKTDPLSKKCKDLHIHTTNLYK